MINSFQRLCLLFVLTLPICSFAQEWVARYDGPANDTDYAYAIAVDNMGNVYVTGVSYDSSSDCDCATVKYDSAGVEQWVAGYDGHINSYDEACAIALDNLGNVYVTGYSCGSGTSHDYATVKYGSSGVEQWVARYDYWGNGDDRAQAIEVDNMGNVYVTGWSEWYNFQCDYATVKYDSSGVEQWVVRYNGPGNALDKATAIAIDSAGNTYVTGESDGSGTSRDYATVKYDSAGVEQWLVRYNGPSNSYDHATAIALDNAGNVYVTGRSFGISTTYDYATVKYDSEGVEQWVARYCYPTGTNYDFAVAIAVDNRKNVYVTGWSWGYGTDHDYATVKYDSMGVEQWVARYNGPGNGLDEACAIGVDAVGNVYVTGGSLGWYSWFDYATIKYDSAGVEQWVGRYGGLSYEGYDWAHDLAIDDAGNVYVTGWSWGGEIFPYTDFDYATIKYSNEGVEKNIITAINRCEIAATIVSGPLQLPEDKKCRVFDITGRAVAPDKIQPGVYFLEIEREVVQKIVKIR